MELCSLVEIYHCFIATYCFYFHGTLKTKALSSSEMLGNVSTRKHKISSQ